MFVVKAIGDGGHRGMSGEVEQEGASPSLTPTYPKSRFFDLKNYVTD